MKLTQLFALASLTLFAALSIPAYAQNTNTPKIDKHEANQQKRIANGIASGELTAREAATLEKREASIDLREAAAKADGNVTKNERAKLLAAQKRTSKVIYRKKHNEREMH
jgi:hypothetical protein